MKPRKGRQPIAGGVSPRNSLQLQEIKSPGGATENAIAMFDVCLSPSTGGPRGLPPMAYDPAGHFGPSPRIDSLDGPKKIAVALGRNLRRRMDFRAVSQNSRLCASAPGTIPVFYYGRRRRPACWMPRRVARPGPTVVHGGSIREKGSMGLRPLREPPRPNRGGRASDVFCARCGRARDAPARVANGATPRRSRRTTDDSIPKRACRPDMARPWNVCALGLAHK